MLSTDGFRIGSGTAACLSVAIQIYKNIKTKSSKDVSHGLIALGYISTVLGIIYGTLLHRSAIYISNAVLFANYIVLHVVKLRNDSIQVSEEPIRQIASFS